MDINISIVAPTFGRKVRPLIFCVLVIILSIDHVVAGRLPDTAANRARGVVGCIQSEAGITCPDREGNSASSGYGGLSPSNQLMLNTMQGLIDNFRSGYEKGLQQQRQKAIQLQQQRRRQFIERQERERLLKQKNAQRRIEFKSAKEKLLGQMRGTNTSSLQPRVLGTLEVEEADSVFGTKSLKPRGLSSLTPLSSKKTSSTSWLQKTNCSMFLLNKANKAAAKGQFQEAAYLGNEAAALAKGEKERPAVVCPSLQNVPDVNGTPTKASQAMAEKIRKRTIQYSILFSRAVQQMESHRRALQSVDQAEQKIIIAQAEKVTAETELAAITKQLNANSGNENNAAMTNAVSKLETAQTALMEHKNVLIKERISLQIVGSDISKTNDMLLQLKRNPGLVTN